MPLETRINISPIYTLANLTIAITWIYHGLVPKLLYMETGELAMLKASGMFQGYEETGIYSIGIAEILFGLAFLFWGRVTILHYLNIAALLILALAAFLIRPTVYLEPFNPATTSLGIMALSCIILVCSRRP